jgi:hypothetical protein
MDGQYPISGRRRSELGNEMTCMNVQIENQLYGYSTYQGRLDQIWKRLRNWSGRDSMRFTVEVCANRPGCETQGGRIG